MTKRLRPVKRKSETVATAVRGGTGLLGREAIGRFHEKMKQDPGEVRLWRRQTSVVEESWKATTLMKQVVMDESEVRVEMA